MGERKTSDREYSQTLYKISGGSVVVFLVNFQLGCLLPLSFWFSRRVNESLKHFIVNIILPGAETEEDVVKALSAQFDKSLHFD